MHNFKLNVLKKNWIIYMEENQSNNGARRSTKVSSFDENEYIEKVNYNMRILSLLGDEDMVLIQEGWKCISESEDFFKAVFCLISENHSSAKVRSKEVEYGGITDERLSHEFVRRHSVVVMKTMQSIFEDIRNPNNWMLEVLRIATLHNFYGVTLVDLKKFIHCTMDTLKKSLGEDNFTPAIQEVWDRVLECIIVCLNQFGIEYEN